ncbi:histidine kinase [Micromonospora sp. WMMA1998]|uniref:sensor histidine kinase n=1 Tax=Micromonospora sp. WMMA1998 TaxID=3015167 RepID=UPI00248B6625|nr:histidine kinase [Micromonospora sp. WMMA1998]WBC15016.1 histidine kinase [Micromonospora sp. WMMA1998]
MVVTGAPTGGVRIGRWARPVVGVAAGVVSAVVEVASLVAAGLLLTLTVPAPVLRRRVLAAVLRYAPVAARWERRRLAWAANRPAPAPPRATGRRAVGYLALRVVPGLLGALTVGVLAVGVVLAAVLLRAVVTGGVAVPDLLLQLVIGAGLLLVNLQAVASVGALDRHLARRMLEPDGEDALRRRIDELTESRAGVMAAVDAERRRIERDLHDGVQQRLVALGMLLGRARRSRDPDRARALLDQAHADVQWALDELREVAWQVYPSALDHSPLDEVLTMVARRTPIPVRIRHGLVDRPPRQVEAVLYFIACEAITNAAKHAGATVIDIEIGAGDGGVEMLVRDDGRGGADPTGSGLRGLARRAAALDGRLDVSSPTGGPTTIRTVLPCG